MSRSLAYSSMPIRTAVSKGKDKCKDEASSGPCPGLQQGMDGHGTDAYAHTDVVMVCTFLTNRDMLLMTRQITGKAMMLDEIINYVQSLQRQVEVSVLKTCDLEVYSMISLGQWLNLHFSCLCWILQFLSMKLSAIRPGFNRDLELQDVRLRGSFDSG
jgi:hypothetical protein